MKKHPVIPFEAEWRKVAEHARKIEPAFAARVEKELERAGSTYGQRLFHYLADTPWRSWFAHLGVTIIISSAFALAGEVIGHGIGTYQVGATVAFGFYLFREIGDWLRYAKLGTGHDVFRGVTHDSDGFGDLLGPFAHWIGVMLPFAFGG